MTNPNIRPAAARAFIRSLNILLKFARMYDFGHPRTKKQYETAWSELRTALGTGTENEAGVLLAVSGDQLLLDGTPLESAAAEKSFARMLSAAGIASIHFSPKVTQASLARFVRGFPTNTGSKPVQLAEQLKTALQGDPHIHVNEVCFVPADSAVARSTVAQQLAAHTLGLSSEASDELFKDPERLLQLIVAAEGSKGGGSGSAAPVQVTATVKEMAVEAVTVAGTAVALVLVTGSAVRVPATDQVQAVATVPAVADLETAQVSPAPAAPAQALGLAQPAVAQSTTCPNQLR